LYPLYYSIPYETTIICVPKQKNHSQLIPICHFQPPEECITTFTHPSLLPAQVLLLQHILLSVTLTSFPLFSPSNSHSICLDSPVRDYKAAAVLLCSRPTLPLRQAHLFPEHPPVGSRAEQKPILSQLLSFVITTLPSNKGKTSAKLQWL